MNAERLTVSNVFDFAQRLPKGKVELDFSNLTIERAAASILMSYLLTSANKSELKLKLPTQDRQKNEVLARNGFLFAIANRLGSVRFEPSQAYKAGWLEEWRRPWTRGTREPMLRLGQEHTEIEPSVFGKDYAAFVNPHRAGGAGHATSGVAEVVRPWLHRMLPKLATTADRSPNGAEFTYSIGRVIDELVDNISEHATTGDSLAVNSVVLVSLARGGEIHARHRLHILVLDTGPGILETASAKIPRAKQGATHTESMNKPTLFEGLFRGDVSLQGRARGFGLPSVWETVCRWDDSKLVSSSNGLLLIGSSSDKKIQIKEVAPIAKGTIVSMSVSLPPKLSA